MNERLKKLAEEAGMNIKTNVIGTALVFGTFEGYKTSHITVEELEKFAELVVKECMDVVSTVLNHKASEDDTPLYKQEWQGLTDIEIHDCFQNRGSDKLKTRKLIAAAIEAKLREKNT